MRRMIGSLVSAVILGGGGLWHDYTFDRAGGLAGLFHGSTLSIPGLAVLPLLTLVPLLRPQESGILSALGLALL